MKFQQVITFVSSLVHFVSTVLMPYTCKHAKKLLLLEIICPLVRDNIFQLIKILESFCRYRCPSVYWHRYLIYNTSFAKSFHCWSGYCLSDCSFQIDLYLAIFRAGWKTKCPCAHATLFIGWACVSWAGMFNVCSEELLLLQNTVVQNKSQLILIHDWNLIQDFISVFLLLMFCDGWD